jgi:hypothetical protein
MPLRLFRLAGPVWIWISASPEGTFSPIAVRYGRRLYPGGESRALGGFFPALRYLENYEYKFAANGAGAGFELDFPFLDDHAVDLRLHLSGSPWGGGFPLQQQHHRRDYSLGPAGDSNPSFGTRTCRCSAWP